MVFFVFTTFLLAVSTIVITFLYFRLKTQEKKNDSKLNEKIIECELLKKDIENLEKEKENLQDSKKEYEQNVDNQLKKYEESFQKLLENSQKTMKESFENLSHNTLKEQTKENKEKIDEILRPFKEKIQECKDAIDKVNGDTSVTINANIKNLVESTNKAQKTAEDLATALKGDKKSQGNWGEMKLKVLFEACGMTEGVDFECQAQTNDNKRPDFIIYLPENKSLIIDSKVSIVNYQNFIACDDEEQKKDFLRRYVNDIKNQIKNLSSKEYERHIDGYETLDFVCMFVPLESAYIEAIKFDNGLYEFAQKNKVAVVTASSLQPIVQTISNLWSIAKSQENIKNVVDKVIKISSKLEKFVSLTNETNAFLVKAVEKHKTATNYLIGKDNIIKNAKEINKQLGKPDFDADFNFLSIDNKIQGDDGE